MKVKEIGFIARAFEKGDEKIHAYLDFLVLKYKRAVKITRIFIFDFLPAYFYEQLSRAKDYVAKKYYESAENFRGRRVLRPRGSVSFFLEQLSEEAE